MLSKKTELKIVKKIVKTNSECIYKRLKDEEDDIYYKVIITPAKNVIITIVDDFVIEGTPCVVIDFENDTKIDTLTIIFQCGKYHEKKEVIGENLVDERDGVDKIDVYFRTNNKIGKLIVKQKMCTFDIYSDRGNQDGYLAGTYSVTYMHNKCWDLDIHKANRVSCENYRCVYDGKTYGTSVGLM